MTHVLFGNATTQYIIWGLVKTESQYFGKLIFHFQAYYNPRVYQLNQQN